MKNLSDMKNDQPFKVPENYFENLGDRIQERIEKEENPNGKNTFQVLKPYIWMAASVLGMALIIKFVITSSVPDNFEDFKISKNTTVVDSPTNSTSIDITADDWAFDDLSETTSDEIIEYLSDYEIEPETLLANL